MVTGKTQLVKTLRDLSTIEKKQRTWISECSDDQLYQIFLLLRSGRSSRSIAIHIKEKWKMRPEANIHSLAQGISKFGKRVEALLGTSLVNDESTHSKSATDEANDSLLGLERLVNTQRQRIEIMMEEEKKLGIKNLSLSKDIMALASLTKTLIKQKEFIVRNGLDPAEERSKELRSLRIDKNFNAWMTNTDQESQQRMIDVFDRFLGAIAADTIPVTIVNDEITGEVHYVVDYKIKENDSDNND
ncbi:MAG: hypothetical protein ACYDHW_08190 [Syntrophorhabdaceae bacterium]